MNDMKKILSACLILVILAGVFCTGCTTATVTNAGVAGRYVHDDNPKRFVELNADGTFYYKSSSYGYHGKWETRANMIRLHTETLGTTIELEKQGPYLLEFDSQGRVKDRFIRED